MPRSIPILCGSIMGEPFTFNVRVHNAAFRAPDVNPVAGKLAGHLVVMDAAFIPVRSRLIRDAEALGCRTVDGTRMMLHQFCGQIELYTGGREAPLDAMAEALLAEIERVSR